MMICKNCHLKNTPFVPSDLELGGKERKTNREIVVNFLKRATEILNANLIRNANYLLSAIDVEPSFEWVGKDKKRFDISK